MSRLLRAMIGATLAAGVVGVVRHRRDTVRVRRGQLPAATAAADLAPARPSGALGERFARWVPQAPRGRAQRLLAALWASPLTFAGVGVALASGVVPRWSAEHRCWVAVGVAGPSGLALRTVGADANTIGRVVISRHPEPPRALLAHEAVHVRQAERLGPLLLPAYLWLAARYGYRDHPLERAARAGARRHLASHPQR